jgi:hypothetical protein
VSLLCVGFRLHLPQDHRFLVAPERAPHLALRRLIGWRDHLEFPPGTDLSKQLGEIATEGLADLRPNDDVPTCLHQLARSAQRIRKTLDNARCLDTPMDAKDSDP